ncbi:GNAT family N-acetyltransferase [Hazenella sp. IB182357]|uniref:GNAT family N-acetyltransferase n=1 Tax=Polycladospora coralii TaxID=2771432 RepID=A0A926N9L6_9BACL|nr:GNAT family N-acetyltransferase [Polycladospora coralii]MBD1371455.1 GNAT family N-acetyltransferase [Polycladospora coralii]MBS7530423.1 GNAT family N-acetyltransferase [Polycladospora coralii]
MIRSLQSDDYTPIITQLNEWWGGREMTHLLPRLFFEHFQDTSYALTKNEHIIAFLIGFRSQTDPTQAYIHFVGVHPLYRQKGLAAQLYHTFFSKVQSLGCTEVRCITSPINQTSIAFHTRLGFQLLPADTDENALPVYRNYDGKGQDRVLFRKILV